MRGLRRWSPVALAMLTLACATAHQLTRISERELAAGDLRHAYRHARAALDKEPANARARAAMTAAATRLAEDWKRRIAAIAAADTVAAARQTLEFGALRREVARYGVALAPDGAYERREAGIRAAAAGIYYSRAERALSDRRPKEAWWDFRTAQEFVPGYREVGRRIQEAYRLALTRVAILPFADQTGVPGLSRALADRVYAEVAPRIRPNDFQFTRLVDRGLVYAKMTVAEPDEGSRDEAARIGRRLGADQVVSGRLYGLRARTDTDTHHQVIYRKVVERDTAGTRRERYVAQDFHAVVREREVTVQYDLEVLDTGGRTPLARFTDAAGAYARVVYTDFEPLGDCADYCLLPPQVKRSEPARGRRAEEEWRRHFGTWTLPALLERARRDRHRLRYEPRDREAFFGDCRERPVYLGGLPGENELAAIALDVIWQPVVGILKELDAK